MILEVGIEKKATTPASHTRAKVARLSGPGDVRHSFGQRRRDATVQGNMPMNKTAG
jgi:hypothetical protein